jgi:hypothetical protein
MGSASKGRKESAARVGYATNDLGALRIDYAVAARATRGRPLSYPLRSENPMNEAPIGV